MNISFSPIGVVRLVDDDLHAETRMPGADISDLSADLQAEILARPEWSSPEAISAWKAEYDPPWQPPEPTKEDLYAERDRRLALGFEYDFGNGRGTHRFATTPKDMEGWNEVTDWANTKIALGKTDAVQGISTETGIALVTPVEWLKVLEFAADSFRQPIWAASFALCAMTPIPADFADDGYWP